MSKALSALSHWLWPDVHDAREARGPLDVRDTRDVGSVEERLRFPSGTTGRNGSPTATTVLPSSESLAVERWFARRLDTVEHERRVAAIATSLFELTADIHGLTRADLRLLRLAALVHDVGRCIDDKTHPAQGASMLLGDPELPLGATDRRLLAYLTLYHRGTVPGPGGDEVLARNDDADRMRKILAVLRAADALDSRSLESPRLVFALVGAGDPAGSAARNKSRDERRLRVTCYLKQDSAKARRVYRRRKKFRLLEVLLGCRVEIDIARAHALHLVA